MLCLWRMGERGNRRAARELGRSRAGGLRVLCLGRMAERGNRRAARECVYDLDLFNLNINSHINPDTNFLCKQIRCNYYSPYKFSDSKSAISDSCLSFLQNNIRSLKRNLDNFQNHLLQELNFNFSLIGLSETRISNADSSPLTFNPNIPGYYFEYVPTPLSAGGVGMYIMYISFQNCVDSSLEKDSASGKPIYILGDRPLQNRVRSKLALRWISRS